MATTFRKIGIRSIQDAATFLVTDWQNLRGMNNCLLYGVGCWGANSSGGNSASPYNLDINFNSTDPVTGNSVNTVATTDFQANGELASSTDRPPTLGYVYVAYGNADGAFAQRVFQSPLISEQNVQTWKSYVADSSMWIGDTSARRIFWDNGGVGLGTLVDIQSMANLNTSSTPFSPNVVGSNFSITYPETVIP